MNINKPHAIGRVSILSFCIAATLAQAQEAGQQEELEKVVVTGFRQSLQDSTEAKRESVGFVDAIFAEDIGKFPDTNIAESFQRIPGIQISREISGEGTTVAIRGLNTNFTRVLLNNAPVSIATAPQEGAGANREVPLDMFPPELFSKLEVFKTPSADMVEGGAAGTINMRMARPFDNDGAHLTYSLQGTDNSNADDLGGRTSLIASNTWDRFGVLAGVTAVRSKVATTGFESVGWANLALTAAQCGTSPCNTTAGNGPSTAPTVPTNASTIAAGLTPGAPVDQAFLLANNPGRTIRQIDNALIPRLGRTMFEEGDRDRYNAVVSLEFRASEDMNFFLDSMYGKQENEFTRQATAWAIRSGSQGGVPIPTQLQVDRENCDNGCVATSGVFPNSQFMLEYRPYIEDSEFYGTNPGMTWQITDKLNLDVQGNYTKSQFDRQASTLLFISDTTTVNYSNTGGDTPTITSSVDLNDPNSWGWLSTDRGLKDPTNANSFIDTGRVNLQDERREAETMGGRFALTWGDSAFSVKVGAAYDEITRDIRPSGADAQWQAQVCGGNPGNFQVNPNSQPACRGETAGQITPGVNNYPAYGAPFSGSLISNAAVPGFLRPSQYGVATVNWDAIRRASNYDAARAAAPESGATPSTANWGSIEEDVTALFTQVSGDMDIGEQRMRYNVGVRYIETDQLVTSRLTFPNPVNTAPTALPDGSRLPDLVNIVPRDATYENWLPSANVSFNLTENAIVRAGLSKTLTRANPTDMLLGLSIRNADVSQVDLGNPELDPYLSDNIDLGFEYYTGAEGYFGAAAFRKGIEGFTQRQSTFIPFSQLAQYGVTLDTLGQQQRDNVINRGGANALVELRQTVNASGRLTINGLEFNWVQPLDFLLSGIGLDGLGFAANYTIIDQKGQGAAPAIAIGVPPESYNATVYYDKHGVSARVSVTHSQGSQGSGPNSNQSGVLGAELFGDDYTQYDFSSSFDFSEIFGWSEMIPQLTVDVVNIADESRRSYQQFSNVAFSYYESGRVVMVGLRGRF